MTYNLFKRNNDVDDLFTQFFSNFEGREGKNLLRSDVVETKKAYILNIEVPGVDKKDIKLSYKNSYLTIEATITNEDDSDDYKYIRKERFTGTYTRSFYVGNINKNSIQASFNNGILSINLPKEQEKEDNSFIKIA